MSINSRNKGKVGELELAAKLREFGYDAKRGQQYHGGGDSPDVVGIVGLHIECKRVEKGNVYDWLDQAIRDCGGSNIPVVMHRRSRRGWVVVLGLEDFLTVWQKANGKP